jgi:small conductance mechanosensitive channel
MENSEKYLNYLSDFAVTYGIKLIGALAALIIGLWLISILTRSLVRLMRNRDVDESLRGFFKTLFNITLKILLLISIASMVGIQTTSFIALLGAVGLALGMALSGTLQNFAGGVMILLFKPLKAGDFIEAQGYLGTVSEIQIFNTILKTPDNKTIIIPNGGLSTGSMVNYSTEPHRRVDMTFGIGYGEKTARAKELLMQLIQDDSRILKDPEPFAAVSELADSSVNFVVRVWVNAEDYWGVYFDMNEKVYNTFSNEGISIPFPQLDVHLRQQK